MIFERHLNNALTWFKDIMKDNLKDILRDILIQAET